MLQHKKFHNVSFLNKKSTLCSFCKLKERSTIHIASSCAHVQFNRNQLQVFFLAFLKISNIISYFSFNCGWSMALKSVTFFRSNLSQGTHIFVCFYYLYAQHLFPGIHFEYFLCTSSKFNFRLETIK